MLKIKLAASLPAERQKREQILQLRAKVLQAEQERMDGKSTVSVSEARKRLRERASEV